MIPEGPGARLGAPNCSPRVMFQMLCAVSFAERARQKLRYRSTDETDRRRLTSAGGPSCTAARVSRKGRGPRRKRMCRASRLQSARHWLPTYRGKDLVRGYARCYGVDRLCAALELQRIGAPVATERVEKLRAEARSRSAQPRERRARDQAVWDEGCGTDWDETFAYIGGRTEAGLAFGLTWQEAESSPPFSESTDEDDRHSEAGSACTGRGAADPTRPCADR